MKPFTNDYKCNWQQAREEDREKIRKWVMQNDNQMFNDLKYFSDQMGAVILEIERNVY